jgi:large subunit ribosomal protein L17
MTKAAVDKLFDVIGPRFGDRQGGYLRIVKLGFRKGDGADTVFVELLGSEAVQEEKRQKRAEARQKRAAEAKKAMEDNEPPLEQGNEISEAKEEDKK